MEKIKCYTMTLFGSTLTDPNIDNILETLKIELEENLDDEENINFQFGVKYLTQDEIDELGEFEGF
ncbi:hypothetical protein EG339_02725 [Chryseobacterium bernardetii]|uniref:Uncharacterized protein n=1 Tax=Chryseobacterium bernardetii TaxID=1241978 RepID=A0A3G6T2A9_9FLAO|nr:hypothetical protein [Chryseobacterium bernardetii]AZB23611.1 hypothetical protein EG339_02725 [Chryseobacterium bernardetii]